MQPLDIRAIDNGEVLILWEDDHRSLYSASYLRLHCRCAHCVDEWTGQVLVNQNRIPANLNMKAVEPVGRRVAAVAGRHAQARCDDVPRAAAQHGALAIAIAKSRAIGWYRR